MHQFWETWAALGAGPKVIKILREGYTLPFWIQPNRPTIISGYVYPPRNSYLTEELHALMQKNAVELVKAQKDFFNQLFLEPKPNNQWRTVMNLSTLSKFQKREKRKMENNTDSKDLPPARGVGNVHRLQGCLLPHSNTEPVQEIPIFSCPGTILPIQSTTFWSLHSSLGVHCGGEGGQTDGFSQGYKTPPVTRQLVGQEPDPTKPVSS